MATLNAGEYVSLYVKKAGQREAAEKARRAQHVALRVNGLDAELEEIKSSLMAKSKGRVSSIKVQLLGARNLPIMDFRKSDPYCKFRFTDIVKKSTVKRGELNPTWAESFIFKIADQSAELPVLRVEILDEDLLPGQKSDDDDLIGRVDVMLEGVLRMDSPIREWFTLGDLSVPPSGPDGSQAQVELDISFYGAQERRLEKEAKLRKRRTTSGSEKGSGKGEELQMNDDNKRMVLLGHLGRTRNPIPDIRRIAIQSMAKTAGEGGVDLPKMSDWASKLTTCFLERIEKDPTPDVRLDALEALCFTTTTASPEAIKAVVTAMKDSNRDVRLAAVNSIRGMAKSGDQMAISAVGGRLEDQDQKVRDAASKVLPKLSNEFDERLVHEAIQRLTSMHAVVRKTAVETLVTVNTNGAPIVIDGLLKVMNDFDVNVKTFAIKELAKQAGRGHPDATAVVADQLDDTRPRVREAAAAALGQMATKTERHALSKLIGVLHDPALDLYGRMGIRAAALKSIRDISLADRGEDLSPRTLNSVGTAVRKLLKSPDWCVRKEAITTFVKASLSADRREILETLLEMLEDPKFEVRSECIHTLETYKNEMDKWVISGIVCRLVSPSGEVRHTASTILSKLLDKDLDEANLVFLGQITQGKIPSHGEIFGLLSKIVARGDEEYLDGFLGCTRHTITPIRRLASDAVKSICIPGQSCVIEALIKNLKHDSSGVKCDSIKTLSQVVLKNDDRAVQIVQDMLNDPDFEVKKMVSDALMKMLAEGDSRRTVALACISLDSGYHSESDRKEALDALGQLAYASSKFKLEGWSIEDADLERFWQQIRIPRGGSNENPSGLFVPRILKSLEDESGWVRRAAVEAIMHCAKKGDQNVIQAVCRLLNDSSFAIRIAAVNSLAALSNYGDKNVTALVLERLNDLNHLVRRKSLETLRRVARMGDTHTARGLMTFLRTSWEYINVRGNDTDIKTEIANLLFHLLGFQDQDKIGFLLEGFQQPKVHVERERIDFIEDFLVSQNLMTRYPGYAERLRNELRPESISEAASNSGFSLKQILLILRVQRRVINKTRTKVFRKTDDFQDEKSNDKSKKRGKLTFQEQVLIQRVHSKSGGVVTRREHTPEPSSGNQVNQSASKLGGRDFDWWRQTDDADAEKIMRRFVSATIRYSAVALAHHRAKSGEEGGKPWDKLRWTQRLRLCEEIHGSSF